MKNSDFQKVNQLEIPFSQFSFKTLERYKSHDTNEKVFIAKASIST